MAARISLFAYLLAPAIVAGAGAEPDARIQDKLTGGVAIGTTEDWDRDLFVQ